MLLISTSTATYASFLSPAIAPSSSMLLLHPRRRNLGTVNGSYYYITADVVTTSCSSGFHAGSASTSTTPALFSTKQRGTTSDDESIINEARRPKNIEEIRENDFNNKNKRRSLFSYLLSTSMATTSTLSNAACLSGDTSVDCIGTYKVPIDDAVLEYLESPEKLRTFAPDLRWVEPITGPKTYEEAIAEIQGASEYLARTNDLVLKGDLESAGKELLYIMPRITVSGGFIVNVLLGETISSTNDNDNNNARRRTSNDGSVKISKSVNLPLQYAKEKGEGVQLALSQLLVALGQCDVLVGQGLRGDLGAPVVAQIQIREDLVECTKYLNELVSAIPPAR